MDPWETVGPLALALALPTIHLSKKPVLFNVSNFLLVLTTMVLNYRLPGNLVTWIRLGDVLNFQARGFHLRFTHNQAQAKGQNNAN